MGLRMGQFLTHSEVMSIVAQTDLSQHKKTMEKVASGAQEAATESIFSGARNVQYDPETLITDRHIQSGKSGRWKDEMNNSQQEEATRIFSEVIQKLGFE